MGAVLCRIACMWAVVLLGTHARAADDETYTVAVAPIATTGVEGANATRLEAALMGGLDRAGLTIIAPEAVAAAADDPACRGGPCMEPLASKLAASHVIVVDVAANGRDYEITFKLLTAQGEEVVATTETCDICGLNEVADIVANRAASVSKKLVALEAPALLRVDTEPKGATVLLDGEAIGITPFEGSVPTGEHEVSVEKRGFIGRSQKIVAVDGMTARYVAQLQAVPKEDNRRLRVGGWASLGIGSGLLVSGITLLALHGRPVRSRCSGDDKDENGLCRFRYNSLPSGIPLAVGGAVGIAVGAALLATARKRERRLENARVLPLSNGIEVRF